MTNQYLIDKIREVMSAKLDKFRKEGKQLTDEEIHNIISNNGTICHVSWGVDDVYQIAQDAKLEVVDEESAKEVLQLCWEDDEGLSYDNIKYYIQHALPENQI